MSERTCGNCRWWLKRSDTDRYGYCHRYQPTYTQIAYLRPETDSAATCGEWADKSITPEQEERRELIRRFAVAIVTAEWAADYAEHEVWRLAGQMAGAEPRQ